jgi:hypothetical protein
MIKGSTLEDPGGDRFYMHGRNMARSGELATKTRGIIRIPYLAEQNGHTCKLRPFLCGPVEAERDIRVSDDSW